ncbi:MAG: hypothetical protein RR135_05810 [Oscillospiraceae bacterium]
MIFQYAHCRLAFCPICNACEKKVLCANQMSNLLAATAAPAELLVRYADDFDVSLDYIFGRTDKPQGKPKQSLLSMLKEGAE